MKVGILGGGQLARMMALAAHPLGIETYCIDPIADVCASDVTRVQQADYTDKATIEKFANSVDVVTFENENIPSDTLDWIQAICPIAPGKKALECAQDRLLEKNLFRELGIATPEYAAIGSLNELQQLAKESDLPLLIKTRRFGYDGKGQFLIKSLDQVSTAWETLKSDSLISEAFIPFDYEVSLISVRNQQGEIHCYPLTKNLHRHGILRISTAPACDDNLFEKAKQSAIKILDHFDYVGVLAIEFFVKGEQLIANEMAPRVHNSGHWTQDGAITCQFENHIRAICNLPLGQCDALGFAAMFNNIGTEPDKKAVLQVPYSHLHTYNKAARSGRKIGHINLQSMDKHQFNESFKQLDSLVSKLEGDNQ